jgi:hypothetical protein
MKTSTGTNEHVDLTDQDLTGPSAENEFSRLALGAGAVMAIIAGIWGLMCIVGGAYYCGGLSNMVRGYISAIFGG